MKKSFIALILVFGVIIGYGVVYARIIPGVDEPFNPPAYYSLTEISYEDSPSTFTMRDLASQGGEVYDYTRHLKHILAEENKKSWWATVLDMLGIEIKDSSPTNFSILNITKTDLDVLNKNTIKAWKTTETYSFFENKNFNDFNRFDNNEETVDKDMEAIKQTEEIEKIYKSFAETLTEIRKTEEEETKLIERIQAASQTAQGEMELNQLQTQLETIQSALNRKRNMLLGCYNQLKTVENQIKNDEALRKYQNLYEKQIMIFDPYDRTELQKKDYKRPEGIGFVNMK